ncbi:SDR family NAD(P)-dependent oxidoreductase [Gammaproteobacteria bacterium]|nr:SDR family NAD(P)-dependent oxidoreductase [Gammaproteobacteria bacterium]
MVIPSFNTDSHHKKNIFITGGSTGIGLALAELFLAQGHRVGVCSRGIRRPSYRKLPQLTHYEADVRDAVLLSKVVKDFAPSGLDIMVANAGVDYRKAEDALNFSLQREMFDINLIGVINAFEAALPGMLKNRTGQLVAISSLARFVGLPQGAGYSASKAAVWNFCDGLTIDLTGTGVCVTTVSPGSVKTDMNQSRQRSAISGLPAERAAKKIQDAINQRMTSYSFPLMSYFTFVILSLLPRKLYIALMKRWLSFRSAHFE